MDRWTYWVFWHTDHRVSRDYWVNKNMQPNSRKQPMNRRPGDVPVDVPPSHASTYYPCNAYQSPDHDPVGPVHASRRGHVTSLYIFIDTRLYTLSAFPRNICHGKLSCDWQAHSIGILLFYRPTTSMRYRLYLIVQTKSIKGTTGNTSNMNNVCVCGIVGFLSFGQSSS